MASVVQKNRLRSIDPSLAHKTPVLLDMADARRRSNTVITALLSGDHDLARQLVAEELEPLELALAAASIATSALKALAESNDRDVLDLWRSTLIRAESKGLA